MSIENLFEQAVRSKLRFDSPKGPLTVEDLYDLPLTSERGVSLDSVGREIQRVLRSLSEDSLVETRPNPAKKRLNLSLELIKHVIGVRQAENSEARSRVQNAAEAERIRNILKDRQDEALKAESVEALQARLNQLEGKA